MVLGGCGSGVWVDDGIEWRPYLLGRNMDICVCAYLLGYKKKEKKEVQEIKGKYDKRMFKEIQRM